MLVEKPVAESPEDARRIGELADSKGLVATVDHSLLYDPQVLRALEQVRAGSIGKVVCVDIFRSSEYPPYEGGPLPPQYRDAGYPWRDLGVHCLYMIQELLGTIEDVDADWRSLGGDPNLAYRRVARAGALRARAGPVPALVEHEADAEPDGHPRNVRRAARGPVRDVRRSPFGHAASQGGRARGQRIRRVVPPLVDVPRGAWKFLRGEVQAFQGLRDLVADFYRRLGTGEAPPVSIEDAAVIVEWTEKVARAAEDEYAAELARFSRQPTADFLVTGASGSLGSAVVRRLLVRWQARTRVRAAAAGEPDRGRGLPRSATSATRTQWTARWRVPSA